MTRRGRGVVLVLLLCGLTLVGCRNVQGVPAARAALEEAGYRNVDISFRSGGGIDLVGVMAIGDPVELRAVAASVWATLPFRFDRLHVTVSTAGQVGDRTFSYEQLTGEFGPRPRGLDRRQVGDEVVVSGLKLVVLLSVGALLSVGLVLGLILVALRRVRRRRRSVQDEAQDDWDGSFPGLGGDDSPTAGTAGAAGPEEMPS